jgi:hypothetical protein
MRPGQKQYVGSTQNGVTSKSYGEWPVSYVFVGANSDALNQVIPAGNKNWSGTWRDAADAANVVNISGSGNSLSASFKYESGSASGNGSWSNCKVEGNTAQCNWTVSHQDDTKTGTRRGTLKATLSSDTITGSYFEDTPQWNYKPGYNASNVTSSMHKGAVWPISLKRQ